MEISRQFLSAARSGNEVTLRTLLPYATVECCDEEGNTALSYAAAAGQLGSLVLLLETGRAETERANSAGWTPLMQAAAGGHIECVRRLLASTTHRPDPSNHYHMSPVVLAAANGHTDTTSLLCDSSSMEELSTALCYAAYHAHLAVVKLLLPMVEVVEDEDRWWGLLEYGVLSGDSEVCRAILEQRGLNNTARIFEVLRAVEGDKRELMALIAESIHDNSEAISEAIKDGDLVVFKALIEQLDSPDNRLKGGGTPLMYAAVIGQLDIIKWLLEEDGIDINAQCEKNQWTALMQAVFHGHYRVVEYLLFAGADPDVGNEEGLNAHSIAAMLDDEYLSEMLVKLGKGTSGKKWWGKLAGKFSTIRALTAFKGKLKEQRDVKETEDSQDTPPKETKPSTDQQESHPGQRESSAPIENGQQEVSEEKKAVIEDSVSKQAEREASNAAVEAHLRHHDTHSVPEELPLHSHVINVQPIIVEEEETEEVVVLEDVVETPSETEDIPEVRIPAQADSGIGSGLTHASIDLTGHHQYDGLELAGIPELPPELDIIEPDLWSWLPNNPQLSEEALIQMGAAEDIVRELAELELLAV